MNQLTYADREFLLQAFDSLKDNWNETDNQLLAASSEWAKRLEPRVGFEHTLARDVAFLARVLSSRDASPEVLDIARSGLIFVVDSNRTGKLGEFGLLGDAFITSYAAHEVRSLTGVKSTYNPPRLTANEQERAKELFFDFVDEPLQDDASLVTNSARIRDSLEGFSSSCLFRRLHANIDFLIDKLTDKDGDNHERECARAGLSYLVCEDDAIDDRHGIIGYLDDHFIAQVAVESIEPLREPWLDLLDTTIAYWPFLNHLVIDDGGGGRPLSEYTIINSALSCGSIRADDANVTTLIVPVAGPTAFLVGFVASLGLVQDAYRNNASITSLRPGQKVLVDFDAVRIFEGPATLTDGREGFELTKLHKRRGDPHDYREKRWLPATEMWRLVPAERTAATRGEVASDISRAEARVTALEFLLNSTRIIHTHGLGEQVLVVMSAPVARDMAKRFTSYGYPLRDVVPMGHVDTNLEVQPWSSRFGHQQPLLVFCSDLDLACEYVDAHSEEVKLAIVSVTGRNTNKAAGIQSLRRSGIRTLLVSPERTAQELPIEDNADSWLWEWDASDLRTLIWPTSQDESGVISRFEARLKRQASAKVRTEVVPCPPASEAFLSLNELSALHRKRSREESGDLQELDEILTQCYSVLTRLLRSATPLTDTAATAESVSQSLTQVKAIAEGKNYLSADEKSAAQNVGAKLRHLFDHLRHNHPKAELVQRFVAESHEPTIICLDARMRPDFEEFLGSSARIVCNSNEAQGCDMQGAIATGWFGKKRMAEILLPPVAHPMVLALYEVETNWYRMFSKASADARIKRRAKSKRDKVFPSVQPWARRPAKPPTAETPPARTDELDPIEDHVRTVFRDRAYQAVTGGAGETEVTARLVLFDGGAYAFLRDSSKANVVTHLMDADDLETDDETADIRHKSPRDLQVGDALLFNRRSSRDVIRDAADAILPDGVRETATSWQAALVEFAEANHLKTRVLWQKLRDAGCPLKQQAIGNWLRDDDMIAPSQHERDVPIIATMTGCEELRGNLDAVLGAIRTVRSAHQRASHTLAKQVLKRAVDVLREEGGESELIEVEADVVIVRVTEVDQKTSKVRSSVVNQLQEYER